MHKVLSLRINYSPYVEIPRYLKIPLIDFRETSKIRPVIQLRDKNVVTSLLGDIHSDRESYNIMIKFTLCVIPVSCNKYQVVCSTSYVPKILGEATLKKPTVI